jgi:Zn-dependent metalloprotease
MMFCQILPDHIARRLQTRIGHPADREALMRRERMLRAVAAAEGPTKLRVYNCNHTEYLSAAVLEGSANQDQSARDIVTALSMAFDLGQRTGARDLVAMAYLDAYDHFGLGYDNAYWDGKRYVSGDGDGRLFQRFSICPDIPIHEAGHADTGPKLAYHDQPGADNESISDIRGAIGRQQLLGLSVHDEEAWLIGHGLLAPGVQGTALRNMLHPGTAYHDDELGSDPQPDHMERYDHTTADEGGVHINSSIPSLAFVRYAQALGDGVAALIVWQSALYQLNKSEASFQDFARVTLAVAPQDALAEAWNSVGVAVDLPRPQPSPAPAPAPSPTPVPDPSGDASFRDAIARYPGLAERLDHLAATHHRTPMKTPDYVAWRLAGDLDLR